MNRRSKKLDQYLNKRVEITFFDGNIVTGVLEWDKPCWVGFEHGFNKYTITSHDGTSLFFRKSHVKSIKEV